MYNIMLCASGRVDFWKKWSRPMRFSSFFMIFSIFLYFRLFTKLYSYSHLVHHFVWFIQFFTHLSCYIYRFMALVPFFTSVISRRFREIIFIFGHSEDVAPDVSVFIKLAWKDTDFRQWQFQQKSEWLRCYC